MDYRTMNDNEIIYMVRENDEYYLNLLMKKYSPLVKKIAYKHFEKAKAYGVDFDDLVQEGYIALSGCVNSFSEYKDVKFYTYLIMCVERKIISYCRMFYANKNLLTYENCCDYNNYLYIPDKDNNVDNFDSLDDEYTVFLRVKNKLKFKDSLIFELRYNGFKYKEIANLLNLSINSVDNRLVRIKKIVQDM